MNDIAAKEKQKESRFLRIRLILASALGFSGFSLVSLNTWAMSKLGLSSEHVSSVLMESKFFLAAGFFVAMQILYGAVRQSYRAWKINLQSTKACPNPIVPYSLSVLAMGASLFAHTILPVNPDGALYLVLQAIVLTTSVLLSIVGSKNS